MVLRFGTAGIESRFEAYVEALSTSLGRADRVVPFRSYCAGLILPGDRKSVELMAARVEPGRVQAAHPSLHHLVAKAEWSDQAVLASVRAQGLQRIIRSVGVARQDCGQLGKQDSCQIAVTLSVANDTASLPIDYRPYLPEPWARDPAGRTRAGVPDDVPPSVPMTMRHWPLLSLDLGAGECPRGYAQRRHTDRCYRRPDRGAGTSIFDCGCAYQNVP